MPGKPEEYDGERCLDFDQIEAFLETGLSSDAVNSHLSTCSSCRERVGSVKENNAFFSSVIEAGAQGRVEVDEPGGIVIPGYRVDHEIHRGSQGIVFRAFHEPTQREVAVKIVLHGGLATRSQRERFQREVELVAALDHPGIVTVYDSGVTFEGFRFYSMRCIDGLNLAEHVREQAQLSLRDRLLLFKNVCDAVNHAHQNGIIHRDLKPSNILVDQEGKPHVVDFGLAKFTDGGGPQFSTMEEGFMGTLAYASPEQASGIAGNIDVRSDVYSLGVILYELVTGEFPYPVDGPMSTVLEHIATAAPAPPSQLTTGGPIDKDLETIMLMALAKDKDRRYQSAGLLSKDIENLLKGDPIDARRDSGWYLFSKMARRYRVHLSIASGLLVLSVVTAILMTFLYQRSRIETEKTRQIKVFLEDTLSSVDAGDGGDVLVRDVLDDAALWIDIALRDQPEVEAALRMIIGNSYRSLGEYSTAKFHLQAGLALRKQLFGNEHPQVAECVNAMSLLAVAEGKLDLAESHSRAALEMREKLLGPDHRDVATNLQNLGQILLKTDRVAEARHVFERALVIRTAHFGEGHADVAMVHVNLARSALPTGNLDEAEARFGKALTIRRAQLSRLHPDLAGTMIEYAELLMRRDDHESARPLLEEAVSLRVDAYSSGHWKAAVARGVLGECMAAHGEVEEAEAMLAAAVAKLESVRGPADAQSILARQRFERVRSLRKSGADSVREERRRQEE